MPRGYRNTLLETSPYVGIDVDYFDKKALERQQRHDLARENYSKFAQDIANQSYLDPDARNEYLKEQRQNYEDVITKYSGNLSAGYQDILGAIEKSKFSPYHNLNKRHVEQEQLRQNLVSQYGAEAIDLSNMPNKLYQRDKEGNLNWINPQDIGAKVVKADDYEKVFENVSKDFQARMSSIEGDLERSNNPYYLQAKTIGNKALLTEVMIDEYVKKYGVDAFINSSNTWSIDNRQNMINPQTGMNKWVTKDASGNIVPNKEQLAHDLKSFIMDRVTNNPFVQRQFVTNKGLELATEHANRLKQDKARIDYENLVKNPFHGEPTAEVVLGNKKFTTNEYEKIQTDKKNINELLRSIKENKTKLDEAITSELGKTTEILTNTDGSINFNKIRETLRKNNPNLGDKEIEEKFKSVETNLRRRLELANNETTYARQLALNEDLEKNIKEKHFKPIINESFNSLNEQDKKDIKKYLGLNEKVTLTPELYAKNFDALTGADFYIRDRIIPVIPGITDILDGRQLNQKPLSEKIRSTRKKMEKTLEQGVDMGEIYTGIANIDDKSPINQATKNINSALSTVQPLEALRTFTTEDGKPIIETDEALKEIISTNDTKIDKVTFIPASANNPNIGANTGYVTVTYSTGTGDDKKTNSYSIKVKADGLSNVLDEMAMRQYAYAHTTAWSDKETAEAEDYKSAVYLANQRYNKLIPNTFNSLDAVPGRGKTELPFEYVSPDGQSNSGIMYINKHQAADGSFAYETTVPTEDGRMETLGFYKDKNEAILDTKRKLTRYLMRYDSDAAKALLHTDQDKEKWVYETE